MIKPYYQEPNITIYHGDCRDILPHLEPVDLVLTDPPYNAENIGPNKRIYLSGTMKLSESEYKDFCNKWFNMSISLTSLIIFSCGIANLWNYPRADWILCWHKPSAIAFNRMGGFNAWEPILIYGKPHGRFGQDYIRQDPLNFSVGPEREHPCPKPMKVWKWLINGGTKKNQSVLDPFMGSGTTLRVAKDLGRRAIGIEIEEKYCEIAVRRLKQEILPLNA